MARKRSGKSSEMTVSEAGRKRGQTLRNERGPRFFEEIGKKGGQRVRELIQSVKKGAPGGVTRSGAPEREGQPGREAWPKTRSPSVR